MATMNLPHSSTPPRRHLAAGGLVVFVVIVACLPLLPFVNSYVVALVVRMLLLIALGQAWNVIAGIGGQMSLGHGVFFGIGAKPVIVLGLNCARKSQAGKQ